MSLKKKKFSFKKYGTKICERFLINNADVLRIVFFENENHQK